VLVVGIVVLEELSNYAIECRIVEIAGTHIDSNRAIELVCMVLVAALTMHSVPLGGAGFWNNGI
jgi:hypothetical protein